MNISFKAQRNLFAFKMIEVIHENALHTLLYYTFMICQHY